MDSVYEIASDLITNMSMSEIETVKSMDRSEMIEFHHSVGTYIRNHYGLWKEDCPLTLPWQLDRKDNGQNYIVGGVDHHPQHPDAVSMDVLNSIWDILHESKPL